MLWETDGHSYNAISIRILKICNYAILKPLFIVINEYITQGTFWANQENTQSTTLHLFTKKVTNKLYHTVSITHLWKRIRKTHINSPYSFLENFLYLVWFSTLSPLYKSVAITHEISKFFECNALLFRYI